MPIEILTRVQDEYDRYWDLNEEQQKVFNNNAWQCIEELAEILNSEEIEFMEEPVFGHYGQKKVLYLMERIASGANSNENPAPADFDVEEICKCLRHHYEALFDLNPSAVCDICDGELMVGGGWYHKRRSIRDLCEVHVQQCDEQDAFVIIERTSDLGLDLGHYLDEEEEETRKDSLSLIQNGVELLGECNNPVGIETLLLFIKPNVETVLENRVTEFSLKSLKDLVQYGSELHRRYQYYKRTPFDLPLETKDNVLEAMIEGHLRDNPEENECYCECGILATTMPILTAEKDSIPFGEKWEKTQALRKRYRDGEITLDRFNQLKAEKEEMEEEEKCRSGHYVGKGNEYHHCDSCSTNYCLDMCIKNSHAPLYNRREALNIMRYLNDERTIEHLLPFLKSEDSDEIAVVLETLNDHWRPEFIQYVISQVEECDARRPTNIAIRILGKRGGSEHVELLLEQLEEYAKLQMQGAKHTRNTVEEALTELREYSQDVLINESAQVHGSNAFKKALKRILKEINVRENERPRSQENWRRELYKWREKQQEIEDIPEWSGRPLSNDMISQIYHRQPITYLELLEIDGMGPAKVSKYGQELLEIVRRNQVDIEEDDVQLGPWELPIDMEGWLLDTQILLIEQLDWEEANDQAALLKSRSHPTKRQLKNMARIHYGNVIEDMEHVEKVLEWKLKTMIWSNKIVKAGKATGVRYAQIKSEQE